MAKAPVSTAAPVKAESQLPVEQKRPLAMPAVLPEAEDFSEFAGFGTENVTSADVLIPRLTILQALSPQCNSRKPEYIEGAEQGMICDVATGEIFPDGIQFVPVYFSKVWLEWFPRNSDKGLANIHLTDEIVSQTTQNDKKQRVLPNGNYVSETAQFFGFNLTAGARKSFIPMSASMLKRSRQWITLATGEKLVRPDGSRFQPPLFYRSYDLTTVPDSNAEGDWFSWKIDRGPALPELADIDWRWLKDESAKFFRELIAGQAKGDLSQEELQTAATGASGEAPM